MFNILNEDCPSYLSDFLFHLKVVKARSERTVEAYYIDIRTFLRYIKLSNNIVPAQTPLCEITIKDVSIELLQNFTLNNAYEFLYYASSDLENLLQ